MPSYERNAEQEAMHALGEYQSVSDIAWGSEPVDFDLDDTDNETEDSADDTL